MRWMTVAVVVLCAGLAQAQDVASGTARLATGQSWSAVGAKTVGSGANVLQFEAGWPGLSASYLRGAAPRFSVGARFGFVYGVEGLVRRALAPGLKLQLLARLTLLDQGRISLGLSFEPGPLFHFYNIGTLAGFSLPVGFRLGIAASSALQLAVLLELPFWIQFGSLSSFNIPVLTGIGVEYFIQSELAVYVRIRMGPTIFSRGVPAEFTFDGAFGVAWRF
ncbi:MAG: hypothetical protein AB1730_18925 [Myxococcota bacterium]